MMFDTVVAVLGWSALIGTLLGLLWVVLSGNDE